MTIVTGREKLKQIEEEVKEGKIEKADTYTFFGIMLKQEGDLKDHIKKLKAKQIK